MRDIRLQKIADERAAGSIPYKGKFDRSHTLSEAKQLDTGTTCQIAGRIMLHRDMGKMAFITLQDHSGRMQIAFKVDTLGKEQFDHAMKVVDLGDFIGIHGVHFTTKKGEPTIEVTSWELLSKAIRQPPEKWHGVADQETAWRQRYLDMMSNRTTFERFNTRSAFIRALREFYWQHSFQEVETPILVNAASGALAAPFKTHHEAYDMDVFLRIAPETFLKECLVGGMDRVFEIGRVFRNEGIDPSHLQDFTMCEHYASYWNYEDNMKFTQDMLRYIVPKICGSAEVQIPNRDGSLVTVNFQSDWPVYTIREVIQKDCGIDIEAQKTADDLRSAIKQQGIELSVDVSMLGRGNLIDQLYKKVSRPKIIQPTFITQHPIDLSPLARINDENDTITDRFQLVVGTWEVVNAYSELIDPVDQAERFAAQATAHAAGDNDAHKKDDEYIKALEYGCPPCSGWGMGIDRMVALLTQQHNIREVVLFPLMKPMHTTDTHDSAIDSAAKSPLQLSAAHADHTLGPVHTDHLLDHAQASHMLEHADYSHLLPAAHGLLEAHATNTKAHLLATGATMAALAKKLGGNEQTWRVAGMLHDLDWDSLDKDAERHCGEELQTMLAGIDAPHELLGDIRAHYAHRYGAEYPLNTMLRKALYCCDELTGFIIAVTRVRPSKKIAEVEVSSVTKKLKDKSFAAQVDREQIAACKDLLGIELPEMIAISLGAMQEIAEELGL